MSEQVETRLTPRERLTRGLAYAERLTAAGVPCQVEVVEGAFHGFDRVAPNVGVSQRFFTSQCNSLRAALALSNRT